MTGALAKYSFGAYLVHLLVRDAIAHAGLNTLSMNALIAVPLITLLTAAGSYAVSALLNRIPFADRYIV